MKEYLQYGLIYLLLDACVSYLFFYSITAFLIFLPGILWFLKEKKKEKTKKREQELRVQFLDGIQLMAAALQAGYSPENALHEARKELNKVYTPDAYIIQEFQQMEVQIGMSRNLELLLLDFGRRSGIDDIQSFAEVFLTARRSGGDLLAIIRNTIFCIQQKQETMKEIETCLSGKMMEQKIMSVIPLLILAYMKLTSPDFLDVMYGNPAGNVIMGICLAIYFAAFIWGRKIVNIEI